MCVLESYSGTTAVNFLHDFAKRVEAALTDTSTILVEILAYQPSETHRHAEMKCVCVCVRVRICVCLYYIYIYIYICVINITYDS